MRIRSFQKTDEASVIALWERCGLIRPWNDPQRDIARKVRVQPELFLVGVLGPEVIASLMAGYEGHRGWINYLAVVPEQQLNGWGRRLVGEAERRLAALGCPKVNLQVRAENARALAFYRALGYEVEDTIALGKRLVSDR